MRSHHLPTPRIFYHRHPFHPLHLDADAVKLLAHNARDAVHRFSPKGELTQHGRKMHCVDKAALAVDEMSPARANRIYKSFASIFMITPLRLITSSSPLFFRLSINMRPEASTAVKIRGSNSKSIISSLVIARLELLATLSP